MEQQRPRSTSSRTIHAAPPAVPAQRRFAGLAAGFGALAVAVAAVLALSVGVLAQSPDRSKAPTPGAPSALKLPSVQKRTLSNGLPVWIVEMHEVPMADVTLIVKSGSTSDPAGKFGVAHYTAAMLDEGAGTRSALELADAIDFLGASLGTTSSFDSSTVHLGTLVSKLDQALPLMADVALRPTFPQTDFERLRKERLTSLLQLRDDPSSLASAAFSRQLFGAAHRFGSPTLGTEAANTAMTVSDLKQFYTTHYQPQNAHLLVVGDVTPAGILPALERNFGSWKGAGPVARPSLPVVAQPAGRHIYLIDKPGAAQSQIRLGLVGVARNTPDYFVLDILNTVLGGSFTSRLNQNLREQHGYAYGASSSFSMRSTPGPFLAGAGVQTDKTAEALKEFFKELDGIHAPVPADELTRARNLEALQFPASFETTSEMASRLAELVVYNLPETFLADYVPRILAVTSGDLERAAGRYLPTDKVVVVIVGDLSKIEQPVRSANVGPVTVLSAADAVK